MGKSRVLWTKANQITSPFMKNRKITYTSGPKKGQTVVKNHNGIDVVGAGSSLDYITAHSAGTVRAAGYDGNVGYFAQIVTAPGVEMVYYHIEKGTLRVKTGDRVAQGQILGRMGATGNVTGAHLHFGIRKDGQWIDPEPYLNADYGEKEETMGEEQFYQMFLQALARYNKELEKKPASGWAKDAWGNAKAAGMLDGTKPLAPMTRQEFAVVAERIGLIK